MKKLLVLALGLFLVACGQYATPEEGSDVPTLEVEGEAVMQEEVMPADEAMMEEPVTEEIAE